MNVRRCRESTYRWQFVQGVYGEGERVAECVGECLIKRIASALPLVLVLKTTSAAIRITVHCRTATGIAGGRHRFYHGHFNRFYSPRKLLEVIKCFIPFIGGHATRLVKFPSLLLPSLQPVGSFWSTRRAPRTTPTA